MYTPPFTYTDSIVNLIAAITAQIEQYSASSQGEDKLRLRKANRIKTIHSSLAIEGNTLSIGQVRDIIDGKNIVAPLKEIQEVKNAISTYELYSSFNPFSIKDLLRAHATMMMALADDAGHFRKGDVGVFNEVGCIHMAPPANRVSALITDLFEWVSKSDVHLLVRSCVFHYEFEFIHPFSDGNGRMGRLWQSLLLGQIHPLFEHLPVENLVYSNQQAYYDAIAKSSAIGESTPFIEFMLGEILNALRLHQGESQNTIIDGTTFQSSFLQTFSASFARTFAQTFARTYAQNIKTMANREKIFAILQHILVLIKTKDSCNAVSLSATVGVSERTIKTYLKFLTNEGFVEYSGTTNNGKWRVVRR